MCLDGPSATHQTSRALNSLKLARLARMSSEGDAPLGIWRELASHDEFSKWMDWIYRIRVIFHVANPCLQNKVEDRGLGEMVWEEEICEDVGGLVLQCIKVEKRICDRDQGGEIDSLKLTNFRVSSYRVGYMVGYMVGYRVPYSGDETMNNVESNLVGAGAIRSRCEDSMMASASSKVRKE